MSSSAVLADQVFHYHIKGDLNTTTGKQAIRMPFAGKISYVTAALITAPAGASAIVDLHKNGTTMYTTQGNRPTIAAGSTYVTATLPDVTIWAAGDVLQLEVDQKGSSTDGADLSVVVGYVGNTAIA